MTSLRDISTNAAFSGSGKSNVPGTSSNMSAACTSGALAGDGDSAGEFSLRHWLTAALECMTNEEKEMRDVSRELAALWKAGHAI